MPADNFQSPRPLRLFLALWPQAATSEALASWQQAWTWPPNVAQVKRERLHLTLHFLGDVPAYRLPQLVNGMHVPFEPLALTFGHAEVWPHGVAVLRPDRTPVALTRLHQALADALQALGLPVDDRPFRPHVTLARRAQGATAPAQGAGLRWQVRRGYVLVQSLPGGSGYQILHRFD